MSNIATFELYFPSILFFFAMKNNSVPTHPITNTETIKQPKKTKTTKCKHIEEEKPFMFACLSKTFFLVPIMTTNNSKEEPHEIHEKHSHTTSICIFTNDDRVQTINSGGFRVDLWATTKATRPRKELVTSRVDDMAVRHLDVERFGGVVANNVNAFPIV